jgi:hypothetical protein
MGRTLPLESVLIASGARPILYSAYRCVVNPGDKVIYPVPSWNNNHYVWISGAEGIVVPTEPEDGFMPTLERIAPHLSEARLLCINTPLNPTGTVIGERRLREIVEAIVEENRSRTRQGRRVAGGYRAGLPTAARLARRAGLTHAARPRRPFPVVLNWPRRTVTAARYRCGTW